MKVNYKKLEKKQIKKIKPKRNFILTSGIVIGIISVALVIFFMLSSIFATEKYYVLSQNVASGTLIKTNMLVGIDVPKNTAPKNAIKYNEVAQGTIYTKYPLKAGDVLSQSNTGAGVKSEKAIPDDWVLTSFSISASDAVDGNIKKGEYFDILGVSDGTAKYLFFNVLALDVSSSTASTVVDSNTKAGATTDTLQYVVGMPASEAAKLQSALASYQSIKLISAPTSLNSSTRNVDNLTGTFKYDNDTQAANLYDGTDNTFSTK